MAERKKSDSILDIFFLLLVVSWCMVRCSGHKPKMPPANPTPTEIPKSAPTQPTATQQEAMEKSEEDAKTKAFPQQHGSSTVVPSPFLPKKDTNPSEQR